MNRHTQVPFKPHPPPSPLLSLGSDPACHPFPSPSIQTELTSGSVPHPSFRTRAGSACPDVFRLSTLLEEGTGRVVTEG